MLNSNEIKRLLNYFTMLQHMQAALRINTSQEHSQWSLIKDANPCFHDKRMTQIFQRNAIPEMAHFIINRVHLHRNIQITIPFCCSVFSLALKTFKILPALKHECLKINSEIMWTSENKYFRIIFSAFYYKADSKAEPQFTTRPFSYYPINKRRLYCQPLHILGSNTHMPDSISKIKIPFPTRKRKKKIKTTIVNISHLLSSPLSLQSNTCSGTPLFHK